MNGGDIMNDYINELADFFEAFSIFIETMKNSTKNDLLERDPLYNELIEKLKKKESIVENLLDKLSNECKKNYNRLHNRFERYPLL